MEIIIEGDVREGKTSLAKVLYDHLNACGYKITSIVDGDRSGLTMFGEDIPLYVRLNRVTPREVGITVNNSRGDAEKVEETNRVMIKKEGTMEIFTRQARGTLSGASKRVYDGLRALGFKNSVTEDYPDAIIQKWIPEDAEMPSAGAYQPLRQL